MRRNVAAKILKLKRQLRALYRPPRHPKLVGLARVTSVYSGIYGRCCCGCSGKHLYPARVKDKGVELRGYPIGEDEVSDRAVKRIVDIVNRELAAGRCQMQDEALTSVVIGKLLYIAYTRQVKP